MSHEQIIAIVIASGLVAGVGIVVGIFLGVSGKLLSVPSDERQAAVRAWQQLRRVRLLRL